MKTSICDIILITFLAAAVASDLRLKKIPNYLSVSVIFIGIIANVYASGTPGLNVSVTGAAIGAGLLLIPYVMGGIGGGDLKMLAAIGALKGAAFVFATFLAAAIAGGCIAMFIALMNGTGIETWNRIKTILTLLAHRINPAGLYDNEKETKHVFPYAGAIAVGTVTALILTRFFSI
jgi:prepilin peptidase CpaA